MEKNRIWKMVGFGFRVLFLCYAGWFVSALLHHFFPFIPLLGFIAQTLQWGAVAFLYCLAAGLLGLLLMLVVVGHIIEDEEKAFLVSFVIMLYILIRWEIIH